MVGRESFVSDQRRWLQKEREAELEQSQALCDRLDVRELERRGLALRHLRISAQSTGLYGRTLLTFEPAQIHRKELPAHSITSGDIVGASNTNEGSESVSGVVIGVSSSAVQVSFEESLDVIPIDSDGVVNITKLANEVTHKRLKTALNYIETGSHSILDNCLLGNSTLSAPLQTLPPQILNGENLIQHVNEQLDDSQKEAVRFALLQKELAVVHGPPGTGKTTTIVEIITQAVKSGLKVLCCAPSNVAVDNLLARLVKNRIKVVRLGHPARVNVKLQKFSLDAHINMSDQTQLVRDIRREIDGNFVKMKKSRSKGEQSGLRREIKELRKELHERERNAVKEILRHSEVVLSTLTSASVEGPLRHVKERHFNITVIDECSQALEMACWIALPFAPKAILAGDHLQLPPTIMSEEAAREGLNFTLMERVIKELGSDVVRMLKVQYRMNEQIMTWASDALYKGEVKAHGSVKSHLLRDLPNVKDNENTSVPLVLIDTTGCDMYEMATPDEISKANEGEVALVCLHVEELISSGLNPADIAVITPYNLQVELIRLQLSSKYPKLEIRSVDGFQGREKEAVVLSLVRSNPNREIGFLAESRRLNVAVTRARRHVAVICNSETVSTDKFLQDFITYLEEHGEVRTGMQYQNGIDSLDLVRPEGMTLTIKDEVKPQESGKESRKKPEKKKRSCDVKTIKKKIPEAEVRSSEPANEEVKKRFHKDEISAEEQETADELKREKFTSVIENFIASGEGIHNLSPELNSHDRMVVHEIAKSHGLIHESTGEGRKRHIVLKKLAPVPPKEEKVQVKSDYVQCSGCLARMPKANIELHKIRCEKSPLQPFIPPAPKVTGVKPKKPKKQTQAQKEEEDIDQLLASFSKIDNVCNGEKCKAKILNLGVTCQFCRVRFCIEHSLPEAHGCGDAARRAARQQISRDGRIYSGSGRPSMKPDAVKRAQIQKKLDKKLNSLSDERKPKKPEKKS
ncbi:DNA-binding protein SMUBP-2-like [Tigriopus californicus]|uniref:DNA-binding protein SMUBP-2-like n=1 Tax=Tigriopus californicus TaxID=6832 RepID=UPI0027DA5B49|nr:DNA-binding protein SMUBP-2-like [Tigriopus californicus]